ncbi:MtN3 and saliva related transmembrane protein [Pricia antarctica]|uniref:MtN3 and saliva related transmembrane protein n=1 Tax=Pricia antarctica TaxID=641691 RepID=A0A1G6Y304_9FLAO|nr:SemiSWEET transporter [Pricia antarctica]SDD84768.1 MtN3 and saliva related transmembrane protein [Pricia antarctica]
MDYIEILGLVAATLTTAAFLPQVFKTWQQKSTKDISLTMYLVMFVGVVLWCMYGILIESFPVTLANALTALLLFTMLLLKLKYK